MLTAKDLSTIRNSFIARVVVVDESQSIDLFAETTVHAALSRDQKGCTLVILLVFMCSPFFLQVVESLVIVDLDDEDRIVKLEDKWNGEEQPIRWGAKLLRRLNAKTLPWIVRVRDPKEKTS